MRKIISFILILIALSTLGIGVKTIADGPLKDLTVDGTPIYYYGSSDRVQTPQNYVEKTSEFRGVWVATVINLNMPLHTSETQYKASYDAILDKMEANHMNAIIFQVRPTNDAFYESDYAPFSRFLTELVDVVIDLMKTFYPSLEEKSEIIKKIIQHLRFPSGPPPQY